MRFNLIFGYGLLIFIFVIVMGIPSAVLFDDEILVLTFLLIIISTSALGIVIFSLTACCEKNCHTELYEKISQDIELVDIEENQFLRLTFPVHPLSIGSGKDLDAELFGLKWRIHIGSLKRGDSFVYYATAGIQSLPRHTQIHGCLTFNTVPPRQITFLEYPTRHSFLTEFAPSNHPSSLKLTLTKITEKKERESIQNWNYFFQ